MSFDRQSARKAIRAARQSLPAVQRIEAAQGLARQLEAVPQLSLELPVAGYWACDGEFPLYALLTGKPKLNYLLPKIRSGARLDFVRWKPGDPLDANRFGIPEPSADDAVAPEAIAVILMPLLGFSRTGNRLGSGGGYYDRTLAPLRGLERAARPLLIGVGYALQELPELTDEHWDVPMDYVATERELIDCQEARR